MKKVILSVLMLVFIMCGLSAQFSIADTDDFRAGLINPAAMSYGNSNGIAWLGNYDEDMEYEDKFSLFLNSDEFAYIFKHGNKDNHTFSFSTEIYKNFYLGSKYSWDNKHWKKGDLNEYLLYRPLDYFSLAANMNDVLDAGYSYRFGVAVRPLFFSDNITHRLSLSADVIRDDEWFKPILGLKTEIVDGLYLGTAYDLESETMQLDFSLAFGNTKIGSQAYLDEEDKYSNSHNYVNISEKFFKTRILPFKQKNVYYQFNLSNEVVDKKESMKIGPFKIVFGKGRTIASIKRELNKIKEDKNIEGIILKGGNISTNMANFKELQTVFEEFKASGKKVIFYYESIGNMNYAFAASIADKIYLNPLGTIDIKGLSITQPYLKDLLSKLGISITNFRSHKYKTAGNIFSEEEMTEAEKESYQALLNSLYDDMANMIKNGRKNKLRKSVEEIIDEGPYFIAEDAFKLGLVDGLIYKDELKNKLKQDGAEAKIVKKNLPQYIKQDWAKDYKDKVAIIYAIGNIHSGKGQEGKTIGSETTAKAIKKAREDKSVKGIIIRVNSGGGSALASDIIAREVQLCRQGKNKKPVVISMGGVAGSGGYYIATLADKIVAQPNTITGSIGVIGIFPNLSKMYDAIGVNWSTVKSGKHSDFGKTHRDLKPYEKRIFENYVESSYWKFVETVARARNLTKEEVHKIAKGRVWTGRQAKQIGLIDALGGLEKAKEIMKELANLQNEIKLVEFTGQEFQLPINFEFKTSLFSNLIPAEMKMIYDYTKKMENYKNEKVLMLMPYEFKLDR